MKNRNTIAVPSERQRVPGDFFRDVVGHPVTDYATLTDVERAVARALGRPLVSGIFGPGAVVGRSGVFPCRSVNMAEIDAQIDKYLGPL